MVVLGTLGGAVGFMTMRNNIAEVLDLDPGQVSVKATTTERLGFVGTEAGAAASAVCLIN